MLTAGALPDGVDPQPGRRRPPARRGRRPRARGPRPRHPARPGRRGRGDPLRRLGLVRAAARRDPRAQRARHRAPRAGAARRRLRAGPRARLDRLRRRACAPGLVLERRLGPEPRPSRRSTSRPSSPWRARGARELEAESRRPEHQKRFVAEARAGDRPGRRARGGRARGEARRDWVSTELVERGRERCRALGWSDTYRSPRRSAERALLEAGIGALTIVRPTIIESALRSPTPGGSRASRSPTRSSSPTAAGSSRAFPGNRLGALRHRPGRPRGQRLRRRRGAPARARPAHDRRGERLAPPARVGRALADHHRRVLPRAPAPRRGRRRRSSRRGAADARSRGDPPRARPRRAGARPGPARCSTASPCRGPTRSSAACTASAAGSSACAA